MWAHLKYKMVTIAPPPFDPASEPVVGSYSVSVYPPFAAWDSAAASALEKALNESSSGGSVALYIHIPFCQKKCDYCYHLAHVGEPAGVVNRYLDSVVRELEIYAARPAMQKRRVSHVFFGGGTPSTLSSAQVRFLGKELRRILSWRNVEEVTFECAPRSVRPDFLKALQDMGVNRISMGVQSFDTTLLKWNGRIHLPHDATRAYRMIRHAGFDCVNLDVMVGMIGETPELWHDTVRRAIKLNPESVTIYQTEIPPNTQLYQDWKLGRLPAPVVSWDTRRARLLYGFAELERAGYTVASGCHAVKDPDAHRFKYLQNISHGGDLIGLGVGSVGYINGVHYQNSATLNVYESTVEQRKLPVQRACVLNDNDQLVREFVLQLKSGEVDGQYFYSKFGVDISAMFAEPLEMLTAEGFLIFSKFGVRLTRAGLLRVERLLPHFYDPKFR